MTDSVTPRAGVRPDGRAPVGRIKPGRRVRVVLAERRRSSRVLRTHADVAEQTEVGERLVAQLMQAQLRLALRLALLTVLTFAAVPLAFALWPALGTVELAGLRLPWVLLGVAAYPFMLALAWHYIRTAERHEQQFAEMVESSGAES